MEYINDKISNAVIIYKITNHNVELLLLYPTNCNVNQSINR